MIANEVFFGALLSILGIVFMALNNYISSHINLQFFWHRGLLETPQSSYGQKWGKIYVIIFGLIALLIGVFILWLGFMDLHLLELQIPFS